LEEIDEQNWEYARRLFQCVAAASRPLLVQELAEFLAFDFEAGPTPTFLADWRPEDPTQTVLSVCSSLLAVVKPRTGLRFAAKGFAQPYGDDSPVVQFAHFSVKEYLTSARLAKATPTISRFYVSMTAAHTIVAQACLGVLLHLDENITKDSLKEFPLAEYAAEHWVGHARFEDVSSSVQGGMKRLFDPSERHFSAWVRVYDPEDCKRRVEESARPVKARATALHYAAFCGIHDVAAFLIVEHSQDVNARGFAKKETPLYVASRRGEGDVARVLLEHGADAEIQDDDKLTPLHRASEEGHAKVARVLLDHGVNTEARDSLKQSPLLLASEKGHLEVARLLLEHGADTEARAHKGNPLLHASNRGHVELVRFFLKHGARANVLNAEGRTPLHLASEYGNLETARVLLEHGVDANAQDADNITPLHLASRPMHGLRERYPDIIRLLLQYKSDIHARDNRGNTPFMRATARGDETMMQLLLECGAEDHRM
jgi:ankyrin repeat protein